MNDLIVANKMTSMQIAEITGKEHFIIMRDIRDEIEKLEAGGISSEYKFVLSSYLTIQNKEAPCYELTKEGVLQLAARYDAVARAKLIEMAMKQEKQIVQPLQIDSKFLFQIATQLEEKEKQITLMKPKVLFADAVAASKTSILVGELAKILRQNDINIGQNRLFEWLREEGYLIKRKGSDWNMPTQYSMDLGLFEIKEHTHLDSSGNNVTTKTAKVTGKGQIYFINKLKGGNEIENMGSF